MIRIRNRLLWIPLWEVDERQRVNATHVRKGRGSFQTLQTLESYSVYVKAVPTQSPTWHAHKLAELQNLLTHAVSEAPMGFMDEA